MDLHEFQAKTLLKEYGLPISPFVVIRHPNEVEQAFSQMNLKEAMLKAQVHAGGRGKGGGIRRAIGVRDAKTIAAELLGSRLITPQTSSAGLPVNQLLVEAPLHILSEYYLAITIDRASAMAILIASKSGGGDIEEKSQQMAGLIQLPVRAPQGLRAYHFVELAKFLQWPAELREKGRKIIANLVRAFEQLDAKLIEINPLAITKAGFVVVDAKIGIDDNAIFRHPTFAAEYDTSQITPQEAAAAAKELSWVALEGNIGCMVNGAGLAMATMDLLAACGGASANFLDIGGAASKESIMAGFSIILSDPKVKALFINIFGGIVDCSLLAEALVEAALQLKPTLPIVVRLEGNRAQEAKAILAASTMNFTTISESKLAAEAVVRAAR